MASVASPSGGLTADSAPPSLRRLVVACETRLPVALQSLADERSILGRTIYKNHQVHRRLPYLTRLSAAFRGIDRLLAACNAAELRRLASSMVSAVGSHPLPLPPPVAEGVEGKASRDPDQARVTKARDATVPLVSATRNGAKQAAALQALARAACAGIAPLVVQGFYVPFALGACGVLGRVFSLAVEVSEAIAAIDGVLVSNGLSLAATLVPAPWGVDGQSTALLRGAAPVATMPASASVSAIPVVAKVQPVCRALRGLATGSAPAVGSKSTGAIIHSTGFGSFNSQAKGPEELAEDVGEPVDASASTVSQSAARVSHGHDDEEDDEGEPLNRRVSVDSARQEIGTVPTATVPAALTSNPVGAGLSAAAAADQPPAPEKAITARSVPRVTEPSLASVPVVSERNQDTGQAGRDVDGAAIAGTRAQKPESSCAASSSGVAELLAPATTPAPALVTAAQSHGADDSPAMIGSAPMPTTAASERVHSPPSKRLPNSLEAERLTKRRRGNQAQKHSLASTAQEDSVLAQSGGFAVQQRRPHRRYRLLWQCRKPLRRVRRLARLVRRSRKRGPEDATQARSGIAATRRESARADNAKVPATLDTSTGAVRSAGMDTKRVLCKAKRKR